jgi:hypothetical protein
LQTLRSLFIFNYCLWVWSSIIFIWSSINYCLLG